MRLFLIPISTRRTLIYSQRLNKITHSTPTLADKVSTRTAQLWLKWEAAETGWQKRVAEYGNKLFNRIAFEEWSLKSIPPLSARRQQQEIEGRKIEVLYPPSVIAEVHVPQILERLSTERNVLHRKRLLWSLIGMPISAPIGLVPLVPNIPFFYLAYRAFSHWKALSGAKHLEFLVKRDLFVPTKSAELDAAYVRLNTTGAAINSAVLEKKKTEVVWAEVAAAIRRPEELPEVLLLREQDAHAIASVVNVPALEVECERASRQVAAQMQLQAKERLKTGNAEELAKKEQ